MDGCSGPGHRIQKLNIYSGCPSIDEFSNICPLLLELPYLSACNSSFTPMSSSMIVNENSINSPNECSSVLVDNYNRINKLLPSIKIDNIVGPSTVVPLNSNNVPQGKNDQPSFFPPEKGSNLPKVNIIYLSCTKLVLTLLVHFVITNPGVTNKMPFTLCDE